jgi:acetyltransferase
MAQIRRAEALAAAEITALTGLLAEVVEDMAAFWRQTAEKLGPGHHLWVAEEEGEAVGSIQLARAGMPNSRHRGEILKLMVSPRFRRRGIAAQLLREAVRFAGESGLTLLVLDTEEGSSGPAFYESQGWQKSGVIPDFATDTAGGLITTVVYWRRVSG